MRNLAAAVAIVPAAAVLMLAGAWADGGGDSLRSLAATYYAKAGQVSSVAGPDSTMDYYDRLLGDIALLSEPAPTRYSAEMWRRLLQTESQLDASLATQLLRNAYQPLTAIRGLGETFVRSSSDGTMQPVAVYVPTTYSAQQPAPLVIFLHGSGQAESHLLAPQFIQDLAEQSGTIVVAPYGRGDFDFTGAERDVYDAFDAASRAFTIDSHRRYLAGY